MRSYLGGNPGATVSYRTYVRGMYEPPSRYNVTVTVARDDGELPDPVAFAVAADQAAWRRSASIASAHMTDRIISIVTVYAPDRHAAVAVARAVVADAMGQLVPSAGAARPRVASG